jgi:hypothetical protein
LYILRSRWISDFASRFAHPSLEQQNRQGGGGGVSPLPPDLRTTTATTATATATTTTTTTTRVLLENEQVAPQDLLAGWLAG